MYLNFITVILLNVKGRIALQLAPGIGRAVARTFKGGGDSYIHVLSTEFNFFSFSISGGKKLVMQDQGRTRTLLGCIFIYSCSFQIKLKFLNFKRNLSGRT